MTFRGRAPPSGIAAVPDAPSIGSRPEPPERQHVAAPPQQSPRSRPLDLEPLSLFLGGATVLVSIGFIAAGIAWPEAADRLLRLLIATLALGFCAARALRLVLPMRRVEDLRTPFDRFARVWVPPAAPRPLRDLSDELRAADDERTAGRRAIPLSVRRSIRAEASQRLRERHGLNLRDPTDHPRIRALVSEPTWCLLRPASGEPGNGDRPAAGVPLSDLTLILDDLESL